MDASFDHKATAPEAADATHEAQKPQGGGLARVQSVRSPGWEAVEEVAGIVRDYMSEWPHIAQWLHTNRGNEFVQHVQGELTNQKQPSTKFPIVLLHGFNSAPGDGMSFAKEIPTALRTDGDAVFEVVSPPFASVEERAKQIAPQLEKILTQTGASKLNLVAHSLGGLDARYLISSMGWADRIASLSTLGTPHHGTPAADLADKIPAAADPALNSIGRFVGKHVDHSPMADDVDVRGNIHSMSEGQADAFNKANPNEPGVYYQSWAGVSTKSGHLDDAELAQIGKIDHPRPDPHKGDYMNPALYATSMLSHSQRNGNLDDGAVPMESAKWGNYQGALMADHWDLIGQDGDESKRTGFDPVEFYRRMAANLARRGY